MRNSRVRWSVCSSVVGREDYLWNQWFRNTLKLHTSVYVVGSHTDYQTSDKRLGCVLARSMGLPPDEVCAQHPLMASLWLILLAYYYVDHLEKLGNKSRGWSYARELQSSNICWFNQTKAAKCQKERSLPPIDENIGTPYFDRFEKPATRRTHLLERKGLVTHRSSTIGYFLKKSYFYPGCRFSQASSSRCWPCWHLVSNRGWLISEILQRVWLFGSCLNRYSSRRQSGIHLKLLCLPYSHSQASESNKKRTFS